MRKKRNEGKKERKWERLTWDLLVEWTASRSVPVRSPPVPPSPACPPPASRPFPLGTAWTRIPAFGRAGSRVCLSTRGTPCPAFGSPIAPHPSPPCTPTLTPTTTTIIPGGLSGSGGGFEVLQCTPGLSLLVLQGLEAKEQHPDVCLLEAGSLPGLQLTQSRLPRCHGLGWCCTGCLRRAKCWEIVVDVIDTLAEQAVRTGEGLS